MINNEGSVKYNYDELVLGVIQEVMMIEEELRKGMKRFRPEIDIEDPKSEVVLIFESKDVLSDTIKQRGSKRVEN